MRFGPRKTKRSASDAGSPRLDYEVDLALFGDRRHRVVALTRGQDMRARLDRVTRTFRPHQGVFALLPVARDWARVGWRAAEVVGAEGAGRWRLRTEGGGAFSGVPGGFMVAAERGSLRRGQTVRVHAGRSLPFGRVVSRRGDAVQVEIAWLGERREVSARRREVLPVRSGLERAGPVVYRHAGVDRLGSLVLSRRKVRWVLGAGGVVLRLPWSRVWPVTLQTDLRPGTRARSPWPVVLRAVRVDRVLHPGLLFSVRGPGVGLRRVSFAELVVGPKVR